MQPKSSSVIKLPDLLNLASDADRIPWEPFRPNVEIYRLYGDGQTGPSAALIRFHPGGKVARHTHEGFEHIFVLSGSQVDDHGSSAAGTLQVNPPGTTHSISSPTGCMVLAIYEKPVRFLDHTEETE
jgi:anti-sigma factor ChrR (cupin superfamily)